MKKVKKKLKTLKAFTVVNSNEIVLNHSQELYVAKDNKSAINEWKDSNDPYDSIEGIVYEVTLKPVSRVKLGVTEEKV